MNIDRRGFLQTIAAIVASGKAVADCTLLDAKPIADLHPLERPYWIEFESNRIGTFITITRNEPWPEDCMALVNLSNRVNRRPFFGTNPGQLRMCGVNWTRIIEEWEGGEIEYARCAYKMEHKCEGFATRWLLPDGSIKIERLPSALFPVFA